MHSRSPVFAALHRLMSFAQWLEVYRMLVEIAAEPKQTFWNMTINLLFDAAAVEWAMVFGSWREDTHWISRSLDPVASETPPTQTTIALLHRCSGACLSRI